MSANKFATMLHKNTNRITLILVYVLLEWILIVLLLLNSLFSYLIVKFADYFGLKRPCLWCSRLDHVFEPPKYQNSYRDLVCDEHANEISRLGFCSNHRRLSESRDMCGDCLSSTLPEVMGNADENLKCCCCGNPRKGNLISETGDGTRSDFVADDQEEEDLILPMEAKHLEFYIEGDDCHLIPVKLMDSDAEGSQKIYKFREEDQGVSDNADVVFDFDFLRRPPVELAVENSCSSAENTTPLCSHETKIENETSVAELAVVESMESNEEEEDDVQATAATREGETNVDSTNQENGPIEDFQMRNLDECTSSDHGSKDAVKHHFPLSSDLYEIEEDKVPDTPASIDRREFGTEDSLDGSVFSDIECAEGVLTVEKLKLALKSERNALNALYRELEEERNASEVAASQTMAMINRLQEEKAAMQMEALQYQRMMEEQSEYDQEALQLLNEELEIYRRKVLDYEAKDRMLMLRSRKDDSTSTSSASSSNAEDSDGVSVDLNHESKEEDGIKNHKIREDVNSITPAGAILYLEGSLASVEEERLSILEQLKVLEQKLVSLNDEEEQQHFKYFYEENGNGNSFHKSPDSGHETNGVANGHFKEVNGKHQEDKIVAMAAKAKRLIPLFDATNADIEDKISNGHENGFHSIAFQHSSPKLKSKKLGIEEEADHVYKRLQTLNADREFIKQCISSLKKGDKGVYLLQEILQHFRDLRSVELRVRSIKDAAT